MRITNIIECANVIYVPIIYRRHKNIIRDLIVAVRI